MFVITVLQVDHVAFCVLSACKCIEFLEFNASLSTGCFPPKFKHAIVTPLEKKGTRNSSQLKNYCPILNILFLSKLLEKVVQNQLQHHITNNDSMPKFQSAYRQFLSTETAHQIFQRPPASSGSGTSIC